MIKRHFIWKAAALLTASLSATLLSAQTGVPVPELSVLDQRMQAVVQRYNLPGASLAVAYRGRLVYARGFGFADRERRLPVQPDSLFRIGSITKPITSVTLLKLQEQGKLRLDDRVFDLLPEYQGVIRDSRLRQITVRQLLHHIAGWDSERSGDPLAATYNDLVAAGASLPPDRETLFRYWLQQPLDVKPGTEFHYSNFGFALAGRIIEKVTGQPYGDVVRQQVLLPQGITHMRLGRSLEGQAAPQEVRYYAQNAAPVLSIFSPQPQLVPAAYGSFSLDLVESAGGWIASAPDLVRLLTAIDNSRTRLLQPSSFQQFVERPAGLKPEASWYGLGILVQPENGGYTLVHDGGAPGTYALFGSWADGRSFAFVTNTDPAANAQNSFDTALVTALVEGFSAVREWPAADQFTKWYPADAPNLSVNAVTSAASFIPGPVSAGELVSLFGVGLSPADGAGVRVYFDATPAPLLYAKDGQINVAAPFDLAGKSDVAITVDNNGLWTAPARSEVSLTQPALFTNGTIPAVRRGSIVELFATGLGALSTPVQDGAIANTIDNRPVAPVTVLLNGRPVVIEYIGPAPGLIYGVFQINIRIPADAPTGNLELRIQSGPNTSPQGPTLVVT